MENAMNGTQRRRKLLDMMRQASAPLSGGALGRETGVSRQVNPPHVVLRGIAAGISLNGQSKIGPLLFPVPGARCRRRSFSAPNDNAELRCHNLWITPAFCRNYKSTSPGILISGEQISA